jgi:hypothetical protein
MNKQSIGGHIFANFNLDLAIAPNIILFHVDLHVIQSKTIIYWVYEHDVFRYYCCTMEKMSKYGQFDNFFP